MLMSSVYSNAPQDQAIDLALRLRDFFMAKTGVEMLTALNITSSGDAANLEYEYNRLFTGPTPPLAPPWASTHLEKSPRLMGQSTIQVNRLCNSLGLAPPPGIPADWLPLELELWLHLQKLQSQNPDPLLAKAGLWLVDHAHSWLPSFLESVRASTNNPHILLAASYLQQWLQLVMEQTCNKTDLPDALS